jgi:hypothetical protein
MIHEFVNLPWHDAELKEIIIDRNYDDIIKILIRWPDDYGGQCKYLEFVNCYAFKAEMNFGIIPPDFILDAECVSESQELIEIKNKWKKMGQDLKLYCYKIVTNSTNSSIKIFAQNYRIIEVE